MYYVTTMPTLGGMLKSMHPSAWMSLNLWAFGFETAPTKAFMCTMFHCWLKSHSTTTPGIVLLHPSPPLSLHVTQTYRDIFSLLHSNRMLFFGICTVNCVKLRFVAKLLTQAANSQQLFKYCFSRGTECTAPLLHLCVKMGDERGDGDYKLRFWE